MLISISRFIEEKLFLQINKEKTQVSRLSPKVKFLGFGFYQNRNGTWTAIVHAKSRAKLRDKMRELLDRRCPRGIEATKELFNSILRGWVNYYGSAISKSYGASEDGWIRRRIRQIYLKQWKRNWTRFVKLWGMHDNKPEMEYRCAEIAFSHETYWARAKTSNHVLTNNIIYKEGWQTIAALKRNTESAVLI